MCINNIRLAYIWPPTPSKIQNLQNYNNWASTYASTFEHQHTFHLFHLPKTKTNRNKAHGLQNVYDKLDINTHLTLAPLKHQNPQIMHQQLNINTRFTSKIQPKQLNKPKLKRKRKSYLEYSYHDQHYDEEHQHHV